jgi:hypothetical protein
LNRRTWAVDIRFRLRRALVPAILVAVASLTAASRSAAQTLDGSVVGQITNGTANAQVPEGLVITLHVFSGMESTQTYTTTVAANNTFRFSDVPLEEGQTLVARTVHDGVTYVSEFITAEPDQDDILLPMTIYETTENPANVAIAQLHIFVDQTGDQLEVGQYCLVSNTGDQTYVGAFSAAADQRTTWSIALPGGVENLRFEDADLGGRFVALDGGFADTRPVLPGAASVEASFTYEMAYSEGLELEQVFNVPVNAAVLVLPGEDLALKGAQLSPEDLLDTQMGSALVFAVVPRAAGGSAVQPIERSRELILGIAALAAAAVTVSWLWRSPAPPPMPPQVRPQVEAIAALDRDYEAGLIAEKQYRQKRTSLKRRLSDQLSSE